MTTPPEITASVERVEPRPMRCSAVAFLYECDAEHEIRGNSIILWELLPVDCPADARPYCYGIGDIDFYDSTGNKKLCHVRTHDFNECGRPVMLRVRGTGLWWSKHGGTCVFRDGRWWMRWECWKNTREARDLNGVVDGEGNIRPSRVVTIPGDKEVQDG